MGTQSEIIYETLKAYGGITVTLLDLMPCLKIPLTFTAITHKLLTVSMRNVENYTFKACISHIFSCSQEASFVLRLFLEHAMPMHSAPAS